MTPLKTVACLIVGATAVVVLAGCHHPVPDYFSLETDAIGRLRTVNIAQQQYRADHGNYARSLAGLGLPAQSPYHPPTDLVRRVWRLGKDDGYKFTLSASLDGYEVHADPLVYGKTGSRTFYPDQSMVIYQNYGPEPASANSPELR